MEPERDRSELPWVGTLPCSAFEQFLLCQDSPSHPCTLFLRLEFHGSVDRCSFERAWSLILDRHPLLRAHRTSDGQPAAWFIQHDARCPIEWMDAPVDPSLGTWFETSQLNLQECIGIRVRAFDSNMHPEPSTSGNSSSDSRCLVWIQFHHACTDGPGVVQLMMEWLQIYDGLCRGTEPNLPSIDSSRLFARNHFGLTWRSIVRGLPKQAIGLLGVRQFLMRRPVPLIPHSPISIDDSQPLAVTARVHRFPRDETRELKRTAHENGCTVNSMLAAAIFCGIHGFRQQALGSASKGWVRMMVPMSMRRHANDRQLPASNVVSSVFLDRTQSQVGNAMELARGIQREIELIQRKRLQLLFSLSIWIKSRVLRHRIRPNRMKRCHTTVVFSNLGKLPTRFIRTDPQQRWLLGDLVLHSVEGLTPLNPHMCIAFTASVYAGSLSLSLRYDHRVITADEAQQLLQRVISQTRCMMAAATAVAVAPLAAADSAQTETRQTPPQYEKTEKDAPCS